MSYRSTYSRVGCDWGDIFGLSPNDLTTQQLMKMKPEKLIEFVSKDGRVERIVGDSLATCDIEQIKCLSCLNQEEIDKLHYIKEKYNECIVNRSEEIKTAGQNSCYNMRDSYVFWKLLDSTNIKLEFDLWIEGKSSIIEVGKINYNKIYEDGDNTMADKIVSKVIAKYANRTYRNGSYEVINSPLTNLVKTLPRAPLMAHMNEIDKLDRNVKVYLLSNPNTPEAQIIFGLRAIAGKKRVPKLNVTLNKSILEKLPSVTRLKLLETLYIHSHSTVNYEDIHTESDLETLLFSTAITHNNRVKNVVKYFNRAVKLKNRST